MTETVELHIKLIRYSPQRDRRFRVRLILPHALRGATSARRPKIGVLAPREMHELRNQAEKLGMGYFDADALMAFKKDRRTIKIWQHQYTGFLAHSGIIRMIPRLLGPQLARAAKFPRLLSDGVPLEEVVELASREVDVMMKKVPNLHYAVGNVGMSVDQLAQNVEALVAGIAECLPRSWGNIKRIQLHATRGRAFVVYTASKRKLDAFGAAAQRPSSMM